MVQIDRTRCTGCGTCVEVCPNGALEIQDGFARLIAERCTGCGACVEACPQEAIALLAETVPAATSRELAVAKPSGQPAGGAQDVTFVRVPPAQLEPSQPAPARSWGTALGAALAYLGREAIPRLARLAADWARKQADISPPSLPSPRDSARQRGPRRHRQRRGRGQ